MSTENKDIDLLNDFEEENTVINDLEVSINEEFVSSSKARKYYSKTLADDIINEYNEGQPVLDITKKYKISTASLYALLEDFNIPKRLNKRKAVKREIKKEDRVLEFSDKDKESIIREYYQGDATTKEIKEIYGITGKELYYLLDHFNLPRLSDLTGNAADEVDLSIFSNEEIDLSHLPVFGEEDVVINDLTMKDDKSIKLPEKDDSKTLYVGIPSNIPIKVTYIDGEDVTIEWKEEEK